MGSSIPSVTLPISGLSRRIRRLKWSLRRRLSARRPVVLPFDGDLRIAVRPVDRLGRRILLDGYSEPEFAGLLDAYLRPGMTYFDVGAHFGQYVLVAAKRVGPSGSVHAFEPTRETYAQLEANLRLNDFPWVIANHNAVYDRVSVMELKLCVNGKGEFNSLGKPMRPDEEVVGVERVPAITLDGYCLDKNIQKIDLLKIDVEGAELNVLRGARDLLKKGQVTAIVCEFNESTSANMGYSTQELRTEFEALGFRLFAFNANSRRLVLAPHRDRYDKTENLIATKNAKVFQALLEEGALET